MYPERMSNYRTSDHTHPNWETCDPKQNKTKMNACFIDLKQAFDSIWPTGLFYKVIDSGVDYHTWLFSTDGGEINLNILQQDWTAKNLDMHFLPRLPCAVLLQIDWNDSFLIMLSHDSLCLSLRSNKVWLNLPPWSGLLANHKKVKDFVKEVSFMIPSWIWTCQQL